jgi:hypothetical protein
VIAPPVILSDTARRARARDAIVAAGLLAFAAVANPDRPLGFDICFWHRLTGYRCLTCGLTRSVCHAIRGDWAGSLAYHPAGILVLLVVIVWTVRSAFEASAGTALFANSC